MIDNNLSEIALEYDVPQWSKISLILFVIIIINLFVNISPNVKFALYADDSVLWIIRNLWGLFNVIKAALDNISEWSYI